MRLNGDLVGLDALSYRQQVHDMCADRDIWRSLVSLDVNGFRNACHARAPHLPQPESDWQALYIMHLARMRMLHISPGQRRYSEHWLREIAPKARIAAAVGIAVKARNADSAERAQHVQAAMSEAVIEAVKDGVDIESEVPEVHRRMKLARAKIVRGP
jgi:hypothetical protein